MRHRIVRLEPEAPAKPPSGEPCNGCGVCCAWAPCPLGSLLTLRWRGACRLLLWRGDERRYLCGACLRPPWPLRWMPTPWREALLRRWIAAGRGCDATLEVAPAPAPR